MRSGQVVAFKPLNEKLAEPRIINSKLPNDLWAYAKADVPDSFDPRRDATGRTYRYILYAPDVIERRIVEHSKLFLGTHDFTNFSSVEPNKNPVRTVKNITVTKQGELYLHRYRGGFIFMEHGAQDRHRPEAGRLQ